MTPAKNHQNRWLKADEIRRQEIRSLTLQGSVNQLRQLYREFFPLLEATESFYRPEREEHLKQLQRRLGY